MANFNEAFSATLQAEGGYVDDPHDPGGETYKGIARSRNPKWPGWTRVDILKTKSNFPRSLDADTDLQQWVSDLYEINYWHKVRGDDIANQAIANSVFDFAVNAGPITSAKLAQFAVHVEPDGVIGDTTLTKLNAEDPRTFLAVFALAKIGRYIKICEGRVDSRKYFYGWVRRTLEGV